MSYESAARDTEGGLNWTLSDLNPKMREQAEAKLREIGKTRTHIIQDDNDREAKAMKKVGAVTKSLGDGAGGRGASPEDLRRNRESGEEKLEAVLENDAPVSSEVESFRSLRKRKTKVIQAHKKKSPQTPKIMLTPEQKQERKRASARNWARRQLQSPASEILMRQLENNAIPFVPEHRFHGLRRWRFDYAILRPKIAIEVDGGIWTRGRHTRGAGFERDMGKLNAAVVLGWRVLRFSPGMVRSGEAMRTIREAMNYPESGCSS